MSDRKAFKFYYSYFEVARELSAKDRLKFYDAIMNKQFYGEEPELTGMANFAYISQRHSIDTQVSGYETKTGGKLTPRQGGTQGGSVGGRPTPSVQEEEKEEEEEKEQLVSLIYPFDSDDFKNAWSVWIKYKKDQHSFTYKSEDSEQIALNQLLKLSGGFEKNALEIIEQSIASGYKGLFALKNQNSKNPETFQERIEDRIDVMQQAQALVKFDEHGNMID